MRQNGVRSNVRFPYGESEGMKKGGSVKKQGYKDRKDESIAMRIKKKKTKSKLAIVKQKTKGSKAQLNQTLFNIDQASKKAKARMIDRRNEKIVKKFIGEK